MVKNLPASGGDGRDLGSIPGWGRSPGEGNGTPLQYSCLENPMDGEAVVHGVAKNQTRLSDFTFNFTSEEEEKKKGYEKIFEEIIVENFPDMEKETVNQVQEEQKFPYRINPRRNTPRHILIKLKKN